MSIDAVIGVNVHFYRLRNIDLLQQGWYAIQLRVHEEGGTKQPAMICHVVPYSHGALRGASTATFWQVDAEQNRFRTQLMRIRYAQEEVDLATMVAFQLTFDTMENILAKNVLLSFQLLFVADDRPVNTDPPSELPVVSSQDFRVRSVLSGVHEYVPLTFDEWHLVQCGVSVHTVLKGYMQRAPVRELLPGDDHDVLDTGRFCRPASRRSSFTSTRRQQQQQQQQQQQRQLSYASSGSSVSHAVGGTPVADVTLGDIVRGVEPALHGTYLGQQVCQHPTMEQRARSLHVLLLALVTSQVTALIEFLHSLRGSLSLQAPAPLAHTPSPPGTPCVLQLGPASTSAHGRLPLHAQVAAASMVSPLDRLAASSTTLLRPSERGVRSKGSDYGACNRGGDDRQCQDEDDKLLEDRVMADAALAGELDDAHSTCMDLAAVTRAMEGERKLDNVRVCVDKGGREDGRAHAGRAAPARELVLGGGTPHALATVMGGGPAVSAIVGVASPVSARDAHGQDLAGNPTFAQHADDRFLLHVDSLPAGIGHVSDDWFIHLILKDAAPLQMQVTDLWGQFITLHRMHSMRICLLLRDRSYREREALYAPFVLQARTSLNMDGRPNDWLFLDRDDSAMLHSPLPAPSCAPLFAMTGKGGESTAAAKSASLAERYRSSILAAGKAPPRDCSAKVQEMRIFGEMTEQPILIMETHAPEGRHKLHSAHRMPPGANGAAIRQGSGACPTYPLERLSSKDSSHGVGRRDGSYHVRGRGDSSSHSSRGPERRGIVRGVALPDGGSSGPSPATGPDAAVVGGYGSSSGTSVGSMAGRPSAFIAAAAMESRETDAACPVMDGLPPPFHAASAAATNVAAVIATATTTINNKNAGSSTTTAAAPVTNDAGAPDATSASKASQEPSLGSPLPGLRLGSKSFTRGSPVDSVKYIVPGSAGTRGKGRGMSPGSDEESVSGGGENATSAWQRLRRTISAQLSPRQTTAVAASGALPGIQANTQEWAIHTNEVFLSPVGSPRELEDDEGKSPFPETAVGRDVADDGIIPMSSPPNLRWSADDAAAAAALSALSPHHSDDGGGMLGRSASLEHAGGGYTIEQSDTLLDDFMDSAKALERAASIPATAFSSGWGAKPEEAEGGWAGAGTRARKPTLLDGRENPAWPARGVLGTAAMGLSPTGGGLLNQLSGGMTSRLQLSGPQLRHRLSIHEPQALGSGNGVAPHVGNGGGEDDTPFVSPDFTIRGFSDSSDSTSEDRTSPRVGGLFGDATVAEDPDLDAASELMQREAGTGASGVMWDDRGMGPASADGVHVVVFVHGFQGNSLDLRLMRDHLLLLYPRLECLMSAANQNHTFDDIAIMGRRLADEVAHYLSNLETQLARRRDGTRKVQRVSFVGHSIGNLVLRAAIAESAMRPYLAYLHTYVSLSGPHVGYMFNPNSIFNSGMWLLKRWKRSTCMHQLAFTDGSDPRKSFIFRLSQKKTLEYFKHVVLIASPQDRYVPYHSARIEMCTAAQRDKKRGAVYREMVTHIMRPLLDRRRPDSRSLRRIDVNFPTGTSKGFNSFIGRTAHIDFLETDVYLRFLLWNITECFS